MQPLNAIQPLDDAKLDQVVGGVVVVPQNSSFSLVREEQPYAPDAQPDDDQANGSDDDTIQMGPNDLVILPGNGQGEVDNAP